MSGNIKRTDAGHTALILKAIAENGLYLATQTIHNIEDTGDILYAESLARLKDATGTVHVAAAFAPQLSGCSDLDLRILDMVLSALAADSALVLGCNLSAANLSTAERFVELFERITLHGDLAPRLVIEIIETYPLVGNAIEHVKMMQALGCRIAIDDFGAGFATPARLLSIPADIVKIDAALLHDVRPGRGGSDSLHHIVGFASCIAPLVVVEAVETKAQLDLARSSGATHAQGFLLSRPVPLLRPQRKKGELRPRRVR